ncbi:MAG: hypothetical protein D8M59_05970 [Planctomycetes bacterium]|nr:hypothetical protein [Planctomycetota bacterium]NOG55869.1 hypothetical protein [Planctomycetota bacterium]
MPCIRAYRTLFLMFLVLDAAVLPLAVLTGSPQDGSSSQVRPKAALRMALARLRTEAETFRETARLTRDQADFAADYEYADRVDRSALCAEVIQPQSGTERESDPSVDGYIRWQLLSFTPDWSALTDNQFRKFVEHMPGLVPHPAGHPDVHDELEQLAAVSARDPDARQQLQQRWESIKTRIHDAELLNHPSIRFRQSVIEQYVKPDRPGYPDPPSGDAQAGRYRAIVLMLHDLEDRIEAGWDTRWIKTQITNTLKACKLDPELSRERRLELIRMVEQLADRPATKSVRCVTFYAEQSDREPDIGYSTFQVRRTTDAAKWIAYLNGHDPTK